MLASVGVMGIGVKGVVQESSYLWFHTPVTFNPQRKCEAAVSWMCIVLDDDVGSPDGPRVLDVLK